MPTKVAIVMGASQGSGNCALRHAGGDCRVDGVRRVARGALYDGLDVADGWRGSQIDLTDGPAHAGIGGLLRHRRSARRYRSGVELKRCSRFRAAAAPGERLPLYH